MYKTSVIYTKNPSMFKIEFSICIIKNLNDKKLCIGSFVLFSFLEWYLKPWNILGRPGGLVH